MHGDEAGFSLLEALVAVAILSGGLIAALEVQSGAARREAAVLSRSQALLTAEALMAEIAAGLHSPPTNISGVSDAGVSWRIELSAVAYDSSEQSAPSLFQASVSATPPDGGRPVILSTLIYREPER